MKTYVLHGLPLSSLKVLSSISLIAFNSFRVVAVAIVKTGWDYKTKNSKNKTKYKYKLTFAIIDFFKLTPPSNHGLNSDESAAIESNHTNKENCREKYEISSRRDSLWREIFVSGDFSNNFFLIYGYMDTFSSLYKYLSFI